MSQPARINSISAAEWLQTCRRAANRIRDELARLPQTADRGRPIRTGEGGDTTLAIDQAAEAAVMAELESLQTALTVVSEERGQVFLAGGGPLHVVVDPIDGSLNAKRGLSPYSLSVAVADGQSMDSVAFAYVCDLSRAEDFWAARGEGAFINDDRLLALPADGKLELLGLESTTPRNVACVAERLEATRARRLRAVGSIALALCYVASGRLDGLVTLARARSVDAAAGQLVVREVGGAVSFVDSEDPLSASLDLRMRSRLAAASSPALLKFVITAFYQER